MPGATLRLFGGIAIINADPDSNGTTIISIPCDFTYHLVKRP